MKILLMEDDPSLGETLHELLVGAGYNVDWVQDGDKAAELTYEHKYDLYIFDINVPEIDGFELLEGLREASDTTPVIFISALVDLASITKGFSLGADDYLKKPFFPEEILMRVQAKLAKTPTIITHGDVTYDTATHEAKYNGRFLHLGEVQQALLALFITNIGRTLDKTILLDALENPSEAALRVHITKIKQITGWDIVNVRGIGYRLEKS
jgi:DNA-binding response OmpR family regulator